MRPGEKQIMNVALNPHIVAHMFLEIYDIFYKELFQKVF